MNGEERREAQNALARKLRTMAENLENGHLVKNHWHLQELAGKIGQLELDVRTAQLL